jgi:hypothetical protein
LVTRLARRFSRPEKVATYGWWSTKEALVGIVSMTDLAKALAKSGQANLLIDAITRQSRAPEGVYL